MPFDVEDGFRQWPMACFDSADCRLITSHMATRGLIEDMRAQIPQILDQYIRANDHVV